jgi:hypothetical protein
MGKVKEEEVEGYHLVRFPTCILFFKMLPEKFYRMVNLETESSVRTQVKEREEVEEYLEFRTAQIQISHLYTFI